MRLAEVVGALSLAADISSGFAMEKGLRTVLVATRLARALGATTEDEGHVFWVSALRFVGCTGFAPEAAALAAGDDISLRRTLVYNAKNPEIIFEHARCAGFPVDSVNEVKGIIDPVVGETR